MKHERVSIFSVSAKETVRLLTIFVGITTVYAIVVICYALIEQPFTLETVFSITSQVSQVVPVAIVITLFVDLGGYYMSLLRNWRNREIIAEAEARVNDEWTEWNKQRVETEAKGEEFSEPQPGGGRVMHRSSKSGSTHVHTLGGRNDAKSTHSHKAG